MRCKRNHVSYLKPLRRLHDMVCVRTSQTRSCNESRAHTSVMPAVPMSFMYRLSSLRPQFLPFMYAASAEAPSLLMLLLPRSSTCISPSRSTLPCIIHLSTLVDASSLTSSASERTAKASAFASG